MAFLLHFWNIIVDPSLELFKECLDRKELSTSMKPGVISLIPKPDKDFLLIENWRLIPFLNPDYTIISLAMAKDKKKKSG